MCVCLSSQTVCVEMTLQVLGVKHGDEVTTSAYTYTASASVIEHIGAKIVLVDTQKDNFEMLEFRSMKVNAPDLRNEDGSTVNSENDPR